MRKNSQTLAEQIQEIQKELERTLQDAQAARSGLNSLKAKKAVLEADIQTLQDKYDAKISAINEAAEKETSKLKKEIDKLHKEIDSLHGTISELQAEEAAAKKELTDRHCELVELAKQTIEENKSLGVIIERCDLAAEEARQYQSTVEELKKNKADLESQISAANNDLASVSKHILAKKSELDKAVELFDTKYTEQENQLKLLLTKCEKAATLFKQLDDKSARTREDLAMRELALNKREEVVSRRESLLKGAEQRVQEYNQFMRL